MKISFYGAAKMVTGSNHMIEANGKKLLLDCGMYQGGYEEEEMNKEEFEFTPSDIDYIVLSHAHIDHSGRIPKLIKEGFTGKIIATKATYDLSKIMLLDSAKIQETDIMWENKKRERSGKPLLEPLYSVSDAERSFSYFDSYYYEQLIKIDDTFTVRFTDAGHILGSAIVELWVTENNNITKIVYSGDIGMKNRAIIRNPSYVDDADYLILESTYGNRIHENYEDTAHKLIEIIDETTMRSGSVVIPSFAVGRTQELLYQFNKHYDSENIEEYKKIPIYVDSPMAINVTEVYEKNSELFNDETKEMIMKGDNPFTFSNLHYVQSVEESKMLNKSSYPKVIISASGMADAGRVRHHLKHMLWDDRNTVLFVGYQAQGSTGRRILDGHKKIKILGEEVAVKAKIESLQGLSAHADLPMLLEWVGKFKNKPKKIFLVHGEDDSVENLKKEIEEKFNIPCKIAIMDEEVEINNFGDSVVRTAVSDIDKRAQIEKEIDEVKILYETYNKKTQEEKSEKYIRKHYDEYSLALLDLKNKLMELIMIEGK